MKVLVVDDDKNIRRLVSFTLKSEGHEVIQAVNGKDGYEQAKVSQPDLILLDIMMPIMNGYETCSNLKSDPDTRDIPVFMLSAKGQMTDLDEAFAVGADNYITKPFDVEKLGKTILFKLESYRSRLAKKG